MRCPRGETVLAALLLATPPSGAPLAAETPRAEGTSPDPARAPLPPPGFLDACLKLIEQGKTQDARELLAPVVAQHRDWARAHLVLALTYHRENRYQQARPLFERALELEPQNHAARFYYGWCLYYLGELDR